MTGSPGQWPPLEWNSTRLISPRKSQSAINFSRSFEGRSSTDTAGSSTALHDATELRQVWHRSSTPSPSEICQMRLLLAASAIALSVAVPAFGQSSGDKPKSLEAIHSEALIDQAKNGYTDAPVEERLVTTHHSAAVDGRTLKYTANAGTLTI